MITHNLLVSGTRMGSVGSVGVRFRLGDFSTLDGVDISENAKDFVKRLACIHPQKRMTVRQAMEHPWLSRYEDELSALHDRATQNWTLRNYPVPFWSIDNPRGPKIVQSMKAGIIDYRKTGVKVANDILSKDTEDSTSENVEVTGGSLLEDSEGTPSKGSEDSALRGANGARLGMPKQLRGYWTSYGASYETAPQPDTAPKKQKLLPRPDWAPHCPYAGIPHTDMAPKGRTSQNRIAPTGKRKRSEEVPEIRKSV